MLYTLIVLYNQIDTGFQSVWNQLISKNSTWEVEIWELDKQA